MVPGGSVPVWLVVENGWIALRAPGQAPGGLVDVFRMPARQVRIASAAQRITVFAGGVRHVLLARPMGSIIGAGLGVAGSVAGLAGREMAQARFTAMRFGNVAMDSSAFNSQGGPAVLAAARMSGAAVRRTGYGVILTLGLIAGLLIALVTFAILVAVLV